MRFEIKNEPYPENGQMKTILQFAWLPTEVEQPITKRKYIIWLDKYHESQIYLEGPNGLGYWFTQKRWVG